MVEKTVVRELVLELIEFSGDVLCFPSKPLRSDKNSVLAVVIKDGYALKFASQTSPGNEKIVMSVVIS